MEIAITTTYDVFTHQEFDHEITKVVHELGDVMLYKQEMTSMGKLCKVEELCTGEGFIIEMLGTGALHLVVKESTYNLVLYNHVMSKHMKPITQDMALVPPFTGTYLSWPACDSNKKVVIVHLTHSDIAIDHISECFSSAIRLAGEAEKQRVASLNIPGENCPPVDTLPDSCVTTDVQSQCIMGNVNQSESSDVGDVVLNPHARQMQEMSETLEQTLSERMEQLTRQMEQLQGQDRAVNASVVKLEAQLDQYKALAKNLLHPLLNMCNKHFTEEMQPADVFQVLQFAQMIDSKPLRECCIKMLQARTEDVLTADTWVDVSADFILTILQQDCLNVDSELTLLLACQRWANHQPGGDQRQHLAPLLPYLRLRTLTAENFMDFTLKHEIFTAQEKFQIMGCIAKPAIKMPDGFCNNGTLRTNESTGLTDTLAGKEMCAMDLVPTRRYNKCSDSSQIKFSKDIVMYGVRLQALPVGTKRKFDQEITTTVKVFIENNDRISVLLEHTFGGKVKNGDYFDVQFPQPCHLNSNSSYFICIYYPDDLARPVYMLQSKSYPDILEEGDFNLCSVSKIFYKIAC